MTCLLVWAKGPRLWRYLLLLRDLLVRFTCTFYFALFLERLVCPGVGGLFCSIVWLWWPLYYGCIIGLLTRLGMSGVIARGARGCPGVLVVWWPRVWWSLVPRGPEVWCPGQLCPGPRPGLAWPGLSRPSPPSGHRSTNSPIAVRLSVPSDSW